MSESLAKNAYVEQWLRKREASTKRNYLGAMHEFVEFTKLSPTELIEARKKEVQSQDEGIKRHAEMLVDQFQEWLMKERKNAHNTAVMKVMAIRSFYKKNFYPLQFAESISFKPSRVRGITREEIKTLYDRANADERMLILFLKDSGISAQDFVVLKYDAVKKELEQGVCPIHINLMREKEDVVYDTFIGEEAINALKLYLEDRKKAGEILTDASPLYIGKTTGKAVGSKALTRRFQHLLKEAGVKGIQPVHTFRKFFETTMGGAGVHPIVAKYWMGHKVAKTDIEAKYIVPSIEQQREMYRNAYAKLRILSEVTTLGETQQKIEIAKRVLATILGEETLHKLEIKIARMKPEEQLAEYDRKIYELKERPDGMLPATPRYIPKIIAEEELDTYIMQGWEFVNQLVKSGKIIVRKLAFRTEE